MSDRLFKDGDLAEVYCPDSGRPSIPPSLICGVLLLRFYDDVSDREAVERMMYDMRWEVARHGIRDTRYLGGHKRQLQR